MTVQELEQYRPIRGGGLVLVSLAILPPLLWELTRSLLMSVATPETPRLTVEIFPILFDVVSSILIIATCMRIDGKVSLGKWIERYWQRNVIGYWLWVHRCEDGQLFFFPATFGHHSDLRAHRGCTRCQALQPPLFFVLPLGGWMSRGQGRVWDMSDAVDFYGFVHLEVRLFRIYSDGYMVVQLKYGADRITLSADGALRWLSLSAGFNKTLWHKLELLIAHDATAIRHCENAIGVIDGAIAKITATSRLKTTKEGKGLLKWLQEERGKLL